MIRKGLLALTILSSCVLSLPVTLSQLENDDVKVMKCIVEALADVLSRPRSVPISEVCLSTLKTDDRLISILRHHNFLRELHEIAVQGGQERAQLQREATAKTPQTGADTADRSMLEALGGPGERSILSQKKRTGNGDGEEGEEESLGAKESQKDNNIDEEVKEKRGNDESPGSHVSVDEWSEGEEKREEEEHEEKRIHPEEENMSKNKKGVGSAEKRHVKTKEGIKDDESEKDKRSAFFSTRPQQEEDEEDVKRAGRESLKRWRSKTLPAKKRAAEKEVPHHSKEVTEEEEEEEKRNLQRSPEEKELQMIARRRPEERKGSEEEGSASRRSEEPEIESLAAIESELENVAQKLHEMRRG